MFKLRFMSFMVAILVLTGSAQAAVLVLSPNGTYVAKSSLAAANTAADAAGKTIVVTSPQTLTANLTLATDRAWRFERGAVVTTTGYTLNLNGAPFTAGDYQVFSGSGTVSFGTPREINALWFGDRTAAAVAAAYAAAVEGSTIKLAGGTWAFGSTQVDLLGKVVHLEGVGYSNYDTPASAGTKITYNGTDSALRINNATSVAKLAIDGGAYGITLGNDSGSGAISWGGVVRDVMIYSCSTAGIKAYAIQLGVLEKVHAQANAGAGMIVAGANNTHGVFIGCRFYNNSTEGVLYGAASSNAQFKFYGCHFESNVFEGFKNETTSLNNTLFDGCWVEGNNTHASHASGYYNFLFNNADNFSVVVRNTMFNGATTANNGHIGFQGLLTIDGNWYQGTAKTALVTYLGTNDTLYNRNPDYVSINGGTVAFSHQNNAYFNPHGETVHWNTNRLLGAGYNNVPRLSGVTITNTGATGTIVFELPPSTGRENITFSATVAQRIDIGPSSGRRIIPVGSAADKDIMSNSAIGDSVTLKSLNSSFWQITGQTGTWVTEP